MGISEGLEVGGERVGSGGDLSDAEFNALVVEGARKGREAPAEPAPRHDPAADTPEVIVASILDPEVNPNIRDGLTVKDSTPEAEPERKAPPTVDWDSPESKAILARGEAALAKKEALEERGAFGVFQDRVAADPSDENVVGALAELKGTAPDVYERTVIQLAAEMAGVSDLDELDEDEWAMQEYLAAMERIDNDVERVEVRAKLDQATRRVEELTQQQSEENFAATKAAVNEFVREHGLKPSDVSKTERYASEVLGWNLTRAFAQDPVKGRELLETAWATMEEHRRVHVTEVANRQLLDAPSTEIGAGLTQMTPWGEMPLQPRSLPPAEVDPRRILARAEAKRTTAAEIRRAVVSTDSSSIKDGLTDAGGRRISLDRATGANRRHEQAERERRARTEGYGRR